MRAVTLPILAVLLALGTLACTEPPPCRPDDVVCEAAHFAEEHAGGGTWVAVGVRELDCREYQPRSGGFTSELCWEFEVTRDDRPTFRKEVDIVLTADGDFVKFGETRTISR